MAARGSRDAASCRAPRRRSRPPHSVLWCSSPAILHGPHPGPYPDAYARLDEARATRRVETPAALADAVGDLIAPDKAATLAHNAWAASSGGAEVTERVAQVVLSSLQGRAGKAAA